MEETQISYPIYVFTTNSWDKIAIVNGETFAQTEKIISPTAKKINDSIIADIVAYEKQKSLCTSPEKIILQHSKKSCAIDQMEYIFLQELSYRSCRVYLSLQYNHRHRFLRLMAFGVNFGSEYCKHLDSINAENLQTLLVNYIQQTAELEMSEQIKVLLKQNKYTFFI